jgi:hypothetical protein
MAQNSTFDWLGMQLDVGGHVLTGLSEGDAFRIDPLSPNFIQRVGNRGFGSWVKKYNRAANMTLNIEWGSVDISVLYKFWFVDMNTPNGVMFNLTFRDSNGETQLSTVGARVLAFPNLALGEGAVVPFVLGTVQMSGLLGGANETPIISAADLPSNLGDVDPIQIPA